MGAASSRDLFNSRLEAAPTGVLYYRHYRRIASNCVRHLPLNLISVLNDFPDKTQKSRISAERYPGLCNRSDQSSFSGLHRLLALTALLPQFWQKCCAGFINLMNASVLVSIYPSSCKAHRVLSSALLIDLLLSYEGCLVKIAGITADHFRFNTIIDFFGLARCRLPASGDRTEIFVVI